MRGSILLYEKVMRLDKFLADAGLGTRSEAKKLLKKNKITVNDVIICDGNYKVTTSDVIKFEDNILVTEEFEYYIFHKPSGCVTANSDNLHKTVFDYIPNNRKNDLFAVGRLDIDTEGLLIITNDGELAHNLLSPKKNVKKTYYAKVKGMVTEDMKYAFLKGIDIGDDKPTLPAELVILESGETSICKVTVQEGRFHEVKRLFLAFDCKVLYLKRISMGEFILDEELKCGEYRKFTEEELEIVNKYKSSFV